MSDFDQSRIQIVKLLDGRWSVRVLGEAGKIEDEHVLDAKPSPATVRALLEEAATHQDALERLVHR